MVLYVVNVVEHFSAGNPASAGRLTAV